MKNTLLSKKLLTLFLLTLITTSPVHAGFKSKIIIGIGGVFVERALKKCFLKPACKEKFIKRTTSIKKKLMEKYKDKINSSSFPKGFDLKP